MGAHFRVSHSGGTRHAEALSGFGQPPPSLFVEPVLVLFDVDGTLVDTAGAGRRALEAAFRIVLGLEEIAIHSARVRFEGKTDPMIMAEIGIEAGLGPQEIDRRTPDLMDAYLRLLQEELRRLDPRRRVLPGVVPLLEALGARLDVHLGLVTSNIEAGARAKLGAFGLNGYFPGGGFSSDHPDRAEIARLAREKLSQLAGRRFSPARVSVIGDTELDIACARANGFRAISVLSGWVSRARLEAARPDALFSDLTDLPAVLAALGLQGN